MTHHAQESVHDHAAGESTWGDRFGFRLWILCFLLMGAHCLLNLISALWAR